VGIDQIIEKVICQIGELEAAYIIGDFAKGRNSKIIDLVLVGENMDNAYIGLLIVKAQKLIDRKIRHLALTHKQMKNYFLDKTVLLI
jgi:hypothetical protein